MNHSKLRRAVVATLVTLAAGAFVTDSAYAQANCPRGALDSRFCDEDGDLVADAPKDSKQWVDPSVLIFAYTPVEDPSVYAKVWEGFLRHMEKVTGKKVQFFPVQSNAGPRSRPCVPADFTSPASTQARTRLRSTVRASSRSP
jgi:phosphonate transport system substrate-binding protein